MFIGSSEEAKLHTWYAKASAAYKGSDDRRWEAARWCAKVVGKYERGGTIGLADFMGVSPDTIENLAHAYKMYITLCSKHEYRMPTRMARMMPTVFYSHFRALYTAMNRYNLTLAETFDILRDIYLDEGGISSRDVDQLTRDKFGKIKDWRNYAERVMKAQASMHKCPDLPKEVREKSYELFNCLGDNVIGD
jgi:hypothetical protein